MQSSTDNPFHVNQRDRRVRCVQLSNASYYAQMDNKATYLRTPSLMGASSTSNVLLFGGNTPSRTPSIYNTPALGPLPTPTNSSNALFTIFSERSGGGGVDSSKRLALRKRASSVSFPTLGNSHLPSPYIVAANSTTSTNHHQHSSLDTPKASDLAAASGGAPAVAAPENNNNSSFDCSFASLPIDLNLSCTVKSNGPESSFYQSITNSPLPQTSLDRRNSSSFKTKLRGSEGEHVNICHFQDPFLAEVAFRGTMELECWLYNLDCRPVVGIEEELAYSAVHPNENGSEENQKHWAEILEHVAAFNNECDGVVHRGFLEGVLNSIEGFWTGLEEWIKMPIPDYENNRSGSTTFKQPRRRRRLVLTGHSLGGALATVAAAACINAVKNACEEYGYAIDVELITFGSPRALSSNTARHLQETLAVSERHVNTSDETDDPFTCVPLNFDHVGDARRVHVGGWFANLSKRLEEATTTGGWIEAITDAKTLVEKLHSIEVYKHSATLFDGFAYVIAECDELDRKEAENWSKKMPTPPPRKIPSNKSIIATSRVGIVRRKEGRTVSSSAAAEVAHEGGEECSSGSHHQQQQRAQEEATLQHIEHMKELLAKEGLGSVRTYAKEHSLLESHPTLSPLFESIPDDFAIYAIEATRKNCVENATVGGFRAALRLIASVAMWQVDVLERAAPQAAESLGKIQRSLEDASKEAQKLFMLITHQKSVPIGRRRSSSVSSETSSRRELHLRIEQVRSKVECARGELDGLRITIHEQEWILRSLNWALRGTQAAAAVQIAVGTVVTLFGDGPTYNTDTIAASKVTWSKVSEATAKASKVSEQLEVQLRQIDRQHRKASSLLKKLRDLSTTGY